MEAPPCHIRKLHAKASAKPVQDLDKADITSKEATSMLASDKADIIGGGDLHSDIRFETVMFPARVISIYLPVYIFGSDACIYLTIGVVTSLHI